MKNINSTVRFCIEKFGVPLRCPRVPGPTLTVCHQNEFFFFQKYYCVVHDSSKFRKTKNNMLINNATILNNYIYKERKTVEDIFRISLIFIYHQQKGQCIISKRKIFLEKLSYYIGFSYILSTHKHTNKMLLYSKPSFWLGKKCFYYFLYLFYLFLSM